MKVSFFGMSFMRGRAAIQRHGGGSSLQAPCHRLCSMLARQYPFGYLPREFIPKNVALEVILTGLRSNVRIRMTALDFLQSLVAQESRCSLHRFTNHVWMRIITQGLDVFLHIVQR